MAKIIQYKTVFLLILFLWCCGSFAQKKYALSIIATDSLNENSPIALKDSFANRTACMDYISQLPQLLQSNGYISASVDSIAADSIKAVAFVYFGKKYKWRSLKIPKPEEAILHKAGIYPNLENTVADQQKVAGLYESVLNFLANTGYPFASVKIDSIRMENNEISGTLSINTGNPYYIDTIKVNGNIKISGEFIRRYLQLKEKDLYREDRLLDIDRQLGELQYVQLTKPTTITLLNTGAEINLYLENRRNNQVNVLIGFLPSNPQTGGKLLVTGEANLRLYNPFGNGEIIGFNWQQLQMKSPRLDLSYARPYLFHSSFGVEGKFELYKRDSFYLNINAEVGINYKVSSQKSISFSTIFYKTNVLNIDTQFVKSTHRLPDMIDLNSNLLSVGFYFNNTNYRFNPRSGNNLQLVMAFGKRKVKPNNSVIGLKDTAFNYASLYDTVGANGYVIRATAKAAHYFPTGKQSTVKTSLDAGWYQSARYFRNEIFQVGGFGLLRGFDEESILTNRFVVASAEYRYLLARNGYFFGFTDFGWARNVLIRQNHSYLGMGGGLAFETKTGIFNISYAVGKRNDQPFDLRQSKIHLGFISVF